jgi:hypothetical protein
MKNLKIFFLITVITMVFASCTKDDEFVTDGELLGAQIQQMIDENNITLVRTYLVESTSYTYYRIDEDETSSFEIDRQIIKVGQTYYNLSKLLKYELYTFGGKKVLTLYFDGYR